MENTGKYNKLIRALVVVFIHVRALAININRIDYGHFRQISSSLKPHSHCAGVATVHPDAGQPVYRDAPGHIS